MDRSKRKPRKPARKPTGPSRKPSAGRRPDALEALQARLAETEQALHALRDGAVDALVVAGPQGELVFTLHGADQPYRRLVEEMSDGALVLSADATILYANRRISTMLDIPLTRLVSVSFSRFVSESDHAAFEAVLREGLKGSSHGEMNLMRGARIVPALLSLNPIAMNDEPAVIAIVTDLSEQKRNEEIVAAEKLARSILEQAAEAVIVCDDTGRIIRANAIAQLLAGRNPMLQRFEFVFPLRLVDSAAQTKGAWFSLGEVLRGEVPRGLEVAYAREEETIRLLLSAGPLLDAQNRVAGCVLTLTDISERERAHDQLRFQANVLQNVRESVIVSDIQGRVMFWNDGARAIFGYNMAEMLGQSLARLFPSQNPEELAGMLLDILEGRDYNGEWEGLRKDGSRIWVDVKTTLLRDAGGRILGFLGVAKEITDRKQAERAQQFLAEAFNVLGSSLDYEKTLSRLARLAVPHFADWCTIFVFDEQRYFRQLALVHCDPSKTARAQQYLQRYPPEEDAATRDAIRTGQAQLLVEGSDGMDETILDPEQRAAARALALKSSMIVPLMSAGRALGVMVFVLGDSGRRYDADDLPVAEALANRAALAVENARLYAEAQQLNSELEKRVTVRTAELHAANLSLRAEVAERERAETTVRALLHLSSRLNSTLDLDALLDLLAQEALRLVNAQRGCAGIRVGHSMHARRYFTRSGSVEEEFTWQRGEGLPGWVLQHGRPYLSHDPDHDAQILQGLSLNAGARSAVCMPILDARAEVIGFFNIRDKNGEEGFTAADVELLSAVAQIAAIAIQNALAYRRIEQGERQLHRLSAHLQGAREEERTRIAREIHDELGQVLTALRMDLSLLSHKFSGSGGVQRSTALNEIRAMGKLVDQTIQSVREIILELRPEMLEDLGLKAAMEWQVQEFQTRTGIACTFAMRGGELEMDGERSIALFRILQESLRNVARHACATHVDIEFIRENNHLLLRIHDDGKGIEQSDLTTTASFGILGMRERSLLLGGSLEIQSEPGAGTTVSVRVPAAPEAQDAL